jgi:D-tyrosyl-tRNA(Tyr) deacylase
MPEACKGPSTGWGCAVADPLVSGLAQRVRVKDVGPTCWGVLPYAFAPVVFLTRAAGMRSVVQRVRSAQVQADGRITGAIGLGVLVLLGVSRGDEAEAAGDEAIRYLANRVLNLRIFPQAPVETDGQAVTPDGLVGAKRSFERSLLEVGGEVLLVSQFTLFGDCRKGRRPSFDQAASPEVAEKLYRRFASHLSELGCRPQEGIFGASMVVSLENDGPVTLVLDTEARDGAGRAAVGAVGARPDTMRGL